MVARPYLGIIQLSRDGCIRASTVFGHNPTLAVFQRHGAPGPWAWGREESSGHQAILTSEGVIGEMHVRD